MKTLAIDFDGVLHSYSKGWQLGKVYDPPQPGALAALRLLSARYRLVVFTAREDLDPVVKWLKKYDLAEYLAEVTNKKPIAALYIDDRGLRHTSWVDTCAQITSFEAGGQL